MTSSNGVEKYHRQLETSDKWYERKTK